MPMNRPHFTPRIAVGVRDISTRERLWQDVGVDQHEEAPCADREMKYAICNMTFDNWSLERAFEFAKECGYSGIEIAPFTLAPVASEISPAQRIRVRRLAERTELGVVGLHQLLSKTAGHHLTTHDASVRHQTASYLGQMAALCRDLGGSLVMLGSPLQRNRQPGMSTREAMRNMAEIIQLAMPEFERSGVVIALEPLGPNESNFLVTTAEGLELMQMIGSPYCQLVLDCKGMAGAGESVPDTLREYHQHMVHFHANDPNRQGPGFGHLDFRPIMAALHEINWQGWISVEAFDYSAGVERVARESIQHLKGAAVYVRGGCQVVAKSSHFPQIARSSHERTQF